MKYPLIDKTAMLCSTENVPNLAVITVQCTFRRYLAKQKSGEVRKFSLALNVSVENKSGCSSSCVFLLLLLFFFSFVISWLQLQLLPRASVPLCAFDGSFHFKFSEVLCKAFLLSPV